MQQVLFYSSWWLNTLNSLKPLQRILIIKLLVLTDLTSSGSYTPETSQTDLTSFQKVSEISSHLSSHSTQSTDLHWLRSSLTSGTTDQSQLTKKSRTSLQRENKHWTKPTCKIALQFQQELLTQASSLTTLSTEESEETSKKTANYQPWRDK